MSKRIKPYAHLGKAARDLFSFAPWEVGYRILHALMMMVISVLAVSWTAQLFDEAAIAVASGASQRFIMLGIAVCICISLPMLFDVIRWAVENIHLLLKSQLGFSNKLFEHNVCLPLVCFENPETFNQRYRAKMANYNGHIVNLFLYSFDLLPQALTIIGVIAAMYRFSPLLVPLALVSVLPTFFTSLARAKLWRKLRTSQVPAARKRDYLWDLMTKKESVKEMKALHFATYIKDQWNQVNTNITDERYRFDQRLRLKQFACQFLQTACYAICVAGSVALMLQGDLTIGIFGACIATFGRLQGLANSIVNMISRVAETADYVDDYYQYFAIEQQQPGTLKIDGFSQSIDIHGLHFRYPGSEKAAIDGLNLSIKKGQCIVIVGENGSGKTTLSKLLTGIFTPDAGEVLFDGQPVMQADKALLYKHISLIGQNFVRYNLTLRENIAMSDTSRIHDDAALNEALRSADVMDVAESLGGLDAMLGREFGGAELSGGQWQKIAIARGLFKQSDFIVLDEPTSALDPLVEFDILSRFLQLTQGKTAVIISHRVGLCRFADRVVVMKDGRVVEDGPHSELLKHEGEYAHIWREQAKWYSA